MFILGDLINIPETETRLPLPWWHRAPLALESRTHVALALTDPKEDRPGDLLVSVLSPSQWRNSFRVRCFYQDAPGVIAKVFGAAADLRWNIAVAETVTVEGGRRHALDLVCEPFGYPKENPSIKPLIDALQAMGFEGLFSEPLVPPTPPVKWHRIGEVRNGWVVDTNGRGLPWRTQVRDQLSALSRTDEFDLCKLVASADTDNRFLRFVVPRCGVQNVVIEHADQPGALFELTTALQKSGLNVLSSLLKRGGVPRGNAVLVAICEPTKQPAGDAQKQESVLREKIQSEIRRIPQDFRADLKLTKGRHSRDVIYARNPEDVIIRVPRHLLPRVLDRRDRIDKSRYAVFLSQRFLAGRPETYAQEVRNTLKAAGCEVVQAPVLAGGTQTSFDEVSSAMWASDAGVVLVGCPDEQNEVAFSLNLAHEFGFFNGQGKPILLLVENDVKVLADLDRFSNAKGMSTPRFSKLEALNSRHADSISARVRDWISSIDSEKLRRSN